MSHDKLTDRALLNTTPATNDVMHIVDVSDTGVDSDGNSKKITVSTLMGAAPVTSVNSATGAVTLTTTNISEGTNQYYTEARVSANTDVVANTAKRTYPTADETKVGLISITSAKDLDAIEAGADVTDEANVTSALSNATLTDISTTIASTDEILLRDVDDSSVIKVAKFSAFGGGSGTVTEVTGVAPISVANTTTTPQVSISAATTSAAGSMSAADKTKLDGIDAAYIKTQYESNADTNAFTDAEKTKLSGIATGAEVNAVDSVNTQTGAVVLDTDDIAEGTTNLYYTDARADARIAAASVTDLSDVTNAGSGAIITTSERNAISSLSTIATSGDLADATGDLSADAIFVESTAGSTTGNYGTGSRVAKTWTSGATLTAGAMYYWTGSAWALTNATDNTKRGYVLAVCSATTDGTEMVLQGVVKTSTNTTGFTAGDTMYMDTTNGTFTNTAPSTSGNIIVQVGVLIDATRGTIYFDPDKTYLTVG